MKKYKEKYLLALCSIFFSMFLFTGIENIQIDEYETGLNDSYKVFNNVAYNQKVEKSTIKLTSSQKHIGSASQNDSEIKICPGGQPLGIKINTKGVLIVGISKIKKDDGTKSSPASVSGIEIGDTIIKINNKEIFSAEDVSAIIDSSKNNELTLTIDRDGKTINKKLTPVKSRDDDKYKIGLWIRDCTAGIGTLTFYDPDTNKFAALGHGITDMDTGTIMKVRDGEVVNSNIISIKKGLKGEPGELRGVFVDGQTNIGDVEKNTKCGIFGVGNSKLYDSVNHEPMKIARKNEVKTGKAQILTTIEGTQPKLYDIEIEKIFSQNKPDPKSMIIRVVDKELLDKTGGIVQGMSGSPILQDGKIVGAVTHVLVNKPDVGYGIYIEWMLKDSQILQND